MRSRDLKLMASTTILWRNLRLRLRVFLVSIWLLFDLKQTNLPVAVRLKRLAAPLFVLIFGIISSQAKSLLISTNFETIKSIDLTKENRAACQELRLLSARIWMLAHSLGSRRN